MAWSVISMQRIDIHALHLDLLACNAIKAHHGAN